MRRIALAVTATAIAATWMITDWIAGLFFGDQD